MEPADLLLRARDELLAALVPPACAACRAPLAAAHAVLCGGCRARLPWLRGPRCPRCALPLPCGGAAGGRGAAAGGGAGGSGLPAPAPAGGSGAPCPAAGAAFAAAWAPLAHDGPARELVAALKFRGALPLARLMAAQIAAGAPPALLRDVTLVPVPLHPARRRRRGFDQAARIATALAARRELPLAPCLRRGGVATRQLGASRAARLTAGRLAVEAVAAVPRRALLVDDVHTTGATFDACARALRAAGCEHVAAVAYARALRR